jgi:hypothetical protein
MFLKENCLMFRQKRAQGPEEKRELRTDVLICALSLNRRVNMCTTSLRENNSAADLLFFAHRCRQRQLACIADVC